MVNVRSLTLHDFRWLGTTSQTRICEAICSTPSFTSLTALAIQGRDFFQSRRHSDCDFQLSLILRHQPLLERLELRSGNWDLERWILPTDVPHLTHLMSRPEEAKALVPGRPITSLVLGNILAMPDQDFWEALTMSTSRIDILKVEILECEVLLPFLQLLSINLQDVQELILDGAGYEHLPTVRA
ncbi:hypothetical protein FRB94_010176 [Tulasnella sp. JGI-2019a]|nr:hypothetical protein FRB94_010176 [Tulasnella sp. JGI-2019a]